ncbi:cupin domain-containing protein [Haloplanus rubicundus]|uniref:Cupin domain-containing protein n=1 Tax=Haloplanus rubicundus TaxID=1547898 RepID=A0A345E9E0_9EURY|nr:cupin domain-containing protein [Haloplanus rubicundus]AXG08812.1 cupin domain-containing protein [Haloplanus rubicundus]
MGYHVVDTDEVEPDPDRPCTRRSLSDLAGLTNMAINRYTAEPGEELPLAYHYHDEQEEAFYVLSGTLHVKTPEGDLEAGPDTLLTVEPDSPQFAYNPEDAEEPVDVVAIGAPAIDGDVHAYDPDS